MKPVDFEEANALCGAKQNGVLPIPAFVSKSRASVTSCWKLDIWERLAVLMSGRVYVNTHTFGMPLQPLFMSVAPIITDPEAGKGRQDVTGDEEAKRIARFT